MMLGNDTVLEVDRISKIYTRDFKAKRKRLLWSLYTSLGLPVDIKNKIKPAHNGFWALKNISFSLKKCEAIGVVGLNGSGKTTLLRVLAGQISPDEGEIRMIGKSAAIIELTAGFRMSASGAKNIYLRGALLGRHRAQIDEIFDEIVEFSELESFIHAPISTYSSGMTLRLAFSIMIMIKPDIFLIDETLSVGDFLFRQKCLSRIRELRNDSAFVFVSHSMDDIKNFCDKAILLHQGVISAVGDPASIIENYKKINSVYHEKKSPKKKVFLAPQYSNTKVIEIIEVYWCDNRLEKNSSFNIGDDVYLKIAFTLSYKPRNLYIGLPIWSESGQLMTGFSTNREGQGLNIIPHKKISLILRVSKINFNPGQYFANLAIHDGPEYLHRGEVQALQIKKSSVDFWGCVNLKYSWTFDSEL